MHLLSYARSSLVCSRLRELLSALQPRAEPFLCWDIWACGMNVSTHISSGSILFLCSCSANGLYQSIVSLVGSSEICSVLTNICQIAHWAAQGKLVPLVRLHQALWPWADVHFVVWCPSKTIHIPASGTPQTGGSPKRVCKIWQRSVPLNVYLAGRGTVTISILKLCRLFKHTVKNT